METKEIHTGTFILGSIVIWCEWKRGMEYGINDNIKKFREEKNLTQQQLADKLYVSRQTVCRWENGVWVIIGPS